MKVDTSVCGYYPSHAIRCFDEEQYALDFINKGKFRMKTNISYRNIECANRKDVDEGNGAYKLYGEKVSGLVHPDPNVPTEWKTEYGEVSHQTTFTNAVYVLCCSVSDDLEMVKHKFGAYPVRINEPKKLAIMIDASLNTGPETFLVFGSLVQYNRNELLNVPDEEKHKLGDLAYIQKDPSFSDDQEFRYCLISMQRFSDDADEALYLDLKQPLRFAEPLW